MRRDISEIAGLRLSEYKKFSDRRGYFSEIFNRQKITGNEFVQDNLSLSTAVGTIRGLHFQTPPFAQAKLVSVIRGAIFDVAVDIRRGSLTYGMWAAVEITAENCRQLLIPAGFAHGFCTLEPDTIVFYKVDAYYAPRHDSGIRWNDPEIGIEWPVSDREVTISDKDGQLPMLANIENSFFV